MNLGKDDWYRSRRKDRSHLQLRCSQKKKSLRLLAVLVVRREYTGWVGKFFWTNPKMVRLTTWMTRIGSPTQLLNVRLDVFSSSYFFMYPLPNRQDFLKRITLAKIFSKFDIKSGFWQVQIHLNDQYKMGFNIPFGQFQWNVMPFRLKKCFIRISKNNEWHFQ